MGIANDDAAYMNYEKDCYDNQSNLPDGSSSVNIESGCCFADMSPDIDPEANLAANSTMTTVEIDLSRVPRNLRQHARTCSECTIHMVWPSR